MKRLLLIIVLLAFLPIITIAQSSGKSIDFATQQLDSIYAFVDMTLEEEYTPIIDRLLAESIPVFKEFGATEKWLSATAWQSFFLTGESSDLAPDIETANRYDEALKTVGNPDNPYLDIVYYYAVSKYDNDPQIAHQYNEKIIAITKTQYLKVNAMVASGWMSLTAGDYENTLKWSEKAEVYIEQLKDSPLKKYITEVYYQKSGVYFVLGYYEKAIIYGEYLIDAQEKYKTFPESYVPNFYFSLGMYNEKIGKKEEGQAYFDKSYDMFINSPPTNYLDRASLAYSLGQAYAESNTERASKLFKESLYLNKKGNAPSYYLAYSMNGLIRLYEFLEEHDSTRFWLDQVLALSETTPIADVLWNVYNSDIYYYVATKNYEKGMATIEKHSKAVNPNFDMNNPATYAMQARQAAFIFKFMRHKFQLLYDKAETTKNKTDIEEALSVAEVIFALDSLQKQNRLASEKDIITLNNYERYRIIVNKVFDIQYLSYTEHQTNPEMIFRLMEKTKGETLMDALVLEQKILPREENIKKAALEEKIALLEKQTLSYKNDPDSLKFYQTKVKNAVLERDKLMAEIFKKYPKYAKLFYGQKLITAKEIQEDLTDNTAFIQYSYTKGNMITYLITTEKQEVIFTPITEDFFDNIHRVHTLLKDDFLVQKVKRQEFIKISNQLYQTLLTPIEKYITDKTHLNIIPEGELYYLPFEILLAKDEDKTFSELDYLIKKYEINYHYSASILKEIQKKPAITDQSLLAFAPVFEENTTLESTTRDLNWLMNDVYRSVRNNAFIGLPNTKKEVLKIAKSLNTKDKSSIFLFEKATHGQLLHTLTKQPYQFIHIATHGLVNYQDARFSALACHPNGEDKLLLASEIQALNIDADLVVLSSCESGIGKLVESEGMIALNRSFIYAGARNVIFSLWKVNDEASSVLMIDFYEKYLEKQNYTTALREAKLKMINNSKTALPTYWAPFVLIGE